MQPPQPAPTQGSAAALRACSGSGLLSEAYDNRTLQRSCHECGGSGVRHADGGSGDAHDRAAGGGSARRSAGSAALAPAAGSAAPLVEHYELELASVKQGMAGCAEGKELRLRAELATQLERHIALLRAAVRRQ